MDRQPCRSVLCAESISKPAELTYNPQPIINTAITDINPVTDPLDRLPRILRKNPEQNLCTCNDVPKIDIINAIVDGATTVEEIRKRTYATMGSGCCWQQVERLIECLCYLQPEA